MYTRQYGIEKNPLSENPTERGTGMEGYNATLDRAKQRRKRRKQRRNRNIVLILAAVVLLALIIFMISRLFTGGAAAPETESTTLEETESRTQSPESTQAFPEQTPKDSAGSTEKSSREPEPAASVAPGEGPDMADTKEMIDDFSDAVFIGASQVANLQKMSEMGKATIYGKVGLNIDTVFTKEFIPLKNGNKGTVMQALSENKFGRVYILLGVNELGWPYMSVFKERYGKIIDEIKKLQPGVPIYVQSILPITKEKSDGDSVHNQANVEKFNKGIQEMCQEKGAYYLDVAQSLKNSQGYLPPGVSKDGVHLNHAYSVKWMNNLSKLTKQAGGQ